MLKASITPHRLAVCRMEPNEKIPREALEGRFFSITRTEDELSIVLPEAVVPMSWQAERGWRSIKIIGPLDFGVIGVVSKISSALANAGISLFVVSTYETDYILVKQKNLELAVQVLQDNGIEIVN